MAISNIDTGVGVVVIDVNVVDREIHYNDSSVTGIGKFLIV
jgi:hypothetical protein